jgi:hypothetical protein
MIAMVESSTSNSGEAANARMKLDLQLNDHEKYGFQSVQAVYTALAGDIDEVFLPEDFIKFQGRHASKAIPKWHRILLAGCAYQLGVVYVNGHQGEFYILGPKVRVENTLLLFEQLAADIRTHAGIAWKNLSVDQKAQTGRRSFNTSYGVIVSNRFTKRERERREERIASTYQQGQEGLIKVSNCLDIMSEEFARSQLSYKQTTIRPSVSSEAGIKAGLKDSDKVSNRRVTSAARGLPGR